MSPCPEESSTQHHNPAKSKGIINDGEQVIFVLGGKRPPGLNGKIPRDAFTNNRLLNKRESIARLLYTSLDELRECVIDPMILRGESYHGIAVATVSEIRTIEGKNENPNQLGSCRALCVIDRVTNNECDGHGVIAFSDDVQGLSTNTDTLGSIKSAIRADLADAFSSIMSLEDLF